LTVDAAPPSPRFLIVLFQREKPKKSGVVRESETTDPLCLDATH
jgi:hypothetical protein